MWLSRPTRGARNWTPDTRFGAWFQRTSVWRRYVVGFALDEFEHMLARPLAPAPVVLDAGCGAGVALPDVAARLRPARIVAVDIDPRQVARARTAASQCSCPVELRCIDLARLDVESESVDIVLCHQVLHHIFDQAAVVAQFFRVLRPGGALLLAESCRVFVRSLPVRLLFRHPDEVQRTARGYLDLLQGSGFTFRPEQTATPDPFWARPDFGLRERLGLPAAEGHEAAEVQVVARRPARTAASALA